jgi:SAM-dependent methyltransferase
LPRNSEDGILGNVTIMNNDRKAPLQGANVSHASAEVYVGSELEVFAHANNWKSYFSSKLKPYIRGAVLEVGAGLGSNTSLLTNATIDTWLCLEPDVTMARILSEKLVSGELPSCCTVQQGVLSDLNSVEAFDTVLYVDVLEHIDADREEVRIAERALRPGGHLIVLSPAHEGLYTAFDKAIGHYRRYSISSLRKLTAPPLKLKSAFYLDSVGSLASVANKMILRSAQPTRGQISFWDTVLVTASKIVDPLTAYRIGKTVIAIWQKETG